MSLKTMLATRFGYHAIEDSSRRRPVQKRTSHEVSILTKANRETASATAREDRRNMTILAWMVRRHLDCVSRFTPHFRIEDENVTKIVRRLLAWHRNPRQFDAL